MTIQEAHLSFKISLDKLDTESYQDIQPEEIDYFLNEAYEEFISERYNPNIPQLKGFEQTQKRRDDLGKLVVRAYLSSTPMSSELTEVKLINFFRNENLTGLISGVVYRHHLSSRVLVLNTVTGDSSWEKIVPEEIDDITELLEDPFNRPDEENPLMTFEGGSFMVYKHPDTTVQKMQLTFLKEKTKVSLDGNKTFETANYTHSEIVKIAVRKALEVIESQRLQTRDFEQRGRD